MFRKEIEFDEILKINKWFYIIILLQIFRKLSFPLLNTRHFCWIFPKYSFVKLHSFLSLILSGSNKEKPNFFSIRTTYARKTTRESKFFTRSAIEADFQVLWDRTRRKDIDLVTETRSRFPTGHNLLTLPLSRWRACPMRDGAHNSVLSAGPRTLSPICHRRGDDAGPIYCDIN